MAGESATERLEALAAAIVDAEPGDPASLGEVARALESARAAGALHGALAAESVALQAALAGHGAAAALSRLAALVGEQTSLAGEQPATAPAVHAAPLSGAAAANRDAETVELVGDFLAEATEALARADAILLGAEKGGADAEQTNALFRVFHTIKGVAGFLELDEIVAVSHATESLLNQVREGALRFERDVFELVFDATALLRVHLDRLRAAVDAGRALERDPAVPALVARIEAGERKASARPAPADAAPAAASAPPAPAPAETLAPAPAAPPQAAPVPPPASAAPAAPAAAASEPPEREAPEPAAAPASGSGAGGKLRETVKVDLERVDSIVEMIGELIIVEAMVVHSPELRRVASLQLRTALNQLTKISRDLQDVAMRMRMVPVRGVFQKMARHVRDLARKTGKDVVLDLAGEDTELDRSMVERLEDPLVHLVRNAVDHGVETPAERAAAGKPARSTLRLAAFHEGGSVVVELTDDGRGLSREKILARAREKGLVREGEVLSDDEVWELVFLPGFSTAARVTEISGRGVGMDVVKRNIEAMRGRVMVRSTPGKGTTFRLVLPLTLAIIDGMLVSCAGERYILPSLSVVESLRPAPGMISRIANRGEIVNVRGEILPLLRLRKLLDLPDAPPGSDERVVVAEGLGRKVGLVADDVLTQQQVVIKPLGNGLDHLEFLAGAAILSDGRVGLILNVDKLATLASRPDAGRRVAGA